MVDVVVFSGGGEGKEVINRSKLPKLLEQVKATFPDDTTRAHELANMALRSLASNELWAEDWKWEKRKSEYVRRLHTFEVFEHQMNTSEN